MQQSTIQIILEYVWVPVVTGMVWLWSRFAGIDVRTTLLEQSDKHYRAQRLEDKKLRDEQRKEILDKIEAHHKLVMSKLDQVDKRVKNGH